MKQPIPADVTKCVQQAVTGTFKSIFGAAPVVRNDTGDAPGEGVVGIISFTGDVPLSLMLGLPQQTSVAMAEQFVGMPIDFDSSDMGDAVGELANVVAGDVVALLDKTGFKAQMGLPSIARGTVEIVCQTNHPSEKIAFDSKQGSFWTMIVTMQGR